MKYGKSYIMYEGPENQLFALVAALAGLGAVMGYTKGGPAGALIGGILGVLIGVTLDAIIKNLASTTTCAIS